MDALVYDLEIVKAVPDRSGKRLEGVEYCDGWDDHVGMGISVIGAYDFREGRFRVFCEDNFGGFVSLAQQRDVLVSFNGLRFDNRVIESVTGHHIPEGRCYDLLDHIWLAAGLGEPFTQAHGGYSLEACAAANFDGHKTGHGALAPVLWQQGKVGAVIDYCINDVDLTRRLFARVVKGREIVNPKTGRPLHLPKPVSLSEALVGAG